MCRDKGVGKRRIVVGIGRGGNVGGKGDGRWETGIFVVWGGVDWVQ